MNAVTESGLYALVLRCRDAMTPGTKSHSFRKWVTSEVIPAIRKTGIFSQFQLPQTKAEALRALADKEEECERLAFENAKLEVTKLEMTPKAEFFDCAMRSGDLILIREAAKLLNPKIQGGMGGARLFRWMRENKWIFGIIERPVVTEKRTIVTMTTKVTQRGLVALLRALTK